MAASPSAAEISRAYRQGLYDLRRKLLAKGIESRYEKGTASTYGRLIVLGANVEYAEYRLLRASNGECALYPRINYRAEGRMGGRTEYEGWDAFDKIESLKSMANVTKEMKS